MYHVCLHSQESPSRWSAATPIRAIEVTLTMVTIGSAIYQHVKSFFLDFFLHPNHTANRKSLIFHHSLTSSHNCESYRRKLDSEQPLSSVSWNPLAGSRHLRGPIDDDCLQLTVLSFTKYEEHIHL